MSNRSLFLILIATLVALAGEVWWIHDSPLLMTVAVVAGLLWSKKPRAAVLTGALLVPLSLYWSAFDITGCSTWWRGRIVVSKMTGDLPYLSWGDVAEAACSRCYGLAWSHPGVAASVEKVEEKQVEGQDWELFRTGLGKFWIPAPGDGLLSFLIWEMTIQQVYESGDVAIRPGDTVVDCGAHVGVFTRYALTRGARKVIAIEPEPTNIACFESNFAAELASGKVLLVRAGVWDREANMPLTMSAGAAHSGSHRFGHQEAHSHGDGVPLFPLDDIVDELGLQQIDFVKMDIEGAEERALRGAERTIRRFKPRMAICTYHGEHDARSVARVIRGITEDYIVEGRDIETQWYAVRPKVLFFRSQQTLSMRSPMADPAPPYLELASRLAAVSK